MPLSILLREFWRGVRRNPAGFAMSAAVQGVCLLLLTLFGVVTLNLLNIMGGARDRVEIYAFVTDDAGPEELKASLMLLAGIADVRYVTKAEALEEMRKDLGPDASLVDVLGYNPLPASLRIRLARGYATGKNLEETERKISIMPGVKEVWSGHSMLSKLERIFSGVIVIDIILLVIIALSMVFVVFQTVESAINTRQKEIDVMRVVGASDATVKGPFYAEGVIQGLTGGALAFVLILLLYQIALTQIPQPIFPAFAIAILDLLLGGVLGYLGADLALSRLVK